MTQKDHILEAFQRNGYKMTLGYILSHSWGYEIRARLSELRKEGHVIQFVRGKTPSDNLYILTPFDKTGQSSMVL
jgi:hypothetical protein